MSGSRNYLHLLLHSLGLIAFLAMVAVIVYHHNVRLDLTPEKRYTLSNHSKVVLEQIDQEVDILAFTRREDPRNPFLEDLLWRVNNHNPKVRSRVIDLNRNPSLARRYGASAYGAIVVESEGRRKVFSAVREEVLVAALLQVTRNYEKVVYFLIGHGERDLSSTDRYRGYSSVRAGLEEEFYKVRTLSLATEGEVPADASVVVAAGPREDLLPEEIAALGRYLDRGGSLLAMVDPESSRSFVAFLRRYGIVLREAVVADGDQRLASSEFLTMRVSDVSRASAITATLDGDPVFSLARPVEFAHHNDGAETKQILGTSTRSWAIPAPGGAVPEDLEYRAGRDERGPFALGVEVRIPLDGEEAPGASEGEVYAEIPRKSARLVVYGNSEFANNFFIELLGNRDLIVNTVNWLALEESLIGVRPIRRELGREQFFVSNRQSYLAFLLSAVVQPAIFLALGIGVFAWRKIR